MLTSDHMKAAEFHDAAARAHRTAAIYHANGDHDAAYELTCKAHDQSGTAHSYSVEASHATARQMA